MPEFEATRSFAVPDAWLPYARQSIDSADVEAVVEVLNSDWLTTGPAVSRLERLLAGQLDVREAIALSSGTAALHAAMFALDIGPGDEVIVPAITFAASANCVVYQGGVPVFADIDPDTMLLDPRKIEQRIGPQTRAIVAVDFAGQPADYVALRSIADRYNLKLVADAAHSLGAQCAGIPVGRLADLTTFSLHPTKIVTAAEGGVVTTDDAELARRIRQFRNHGFSTDHHRRSTAGACVSEMAVLGYNYRLSDLHAALGASQLAKLPRFLRRRQEIGTAYDRAFATVPGIEPLGVREGVVHARHLYVVRLDSKVLGCSRDEFYRAMRAEGIGVAVHYLPVYRQPYYRDKLEAGIACCPTAERLFPTILSLPIFPAMSDAEVRRVVAAIEQCGRRFDRASAAHLGTDASADSENRASNFHASYATECET